MRLASDPEPLPGAARRLVLLGYRNDLARHRALAYLQEQGCAPPADAPLPYAVCERIDALHGQALLAALERLGGVARLVQRDDAPLPQLAADDNAVELAAPGEAPARFAGSARAIRLLIIIGIGAAWIIRLSRPSQEIVLPGIVPPPRAAPPPAAVAARVPSAQIKRLIAQGDLDAAQQHIDEALADGADATTLALQGDVRARRGDWPQARKSYERAVELGAKDPNVFLALSSIYRQQGMQGAAVDMLHRAQQNGASGQDFEAMKQTVVAEQDAESGFGSTTSPHFAVSFDTGADNAAAQLILTQLEDAYMIVGHKLGVCPSERTPVVLYAARDFQRVTHSPEWAGALYDGRIKVPVRGLQRDTPDLAPTIRHEYAHALIMTLSGGRCPVWLNEGVAMWAEEERDGERTDWAEGALQLHRPFTLAQLERSFVGLSPTQAAAAYAQSYLAVRRIIARYGDRSLQKLLAAFAATDSTADAFREALPIELSSFEDELRRDHDGSSAH